jgi:hypothetical protein
MVMAGVAVSGAPGGVDRSLARAALFCVAADEAAFVVLLRFLGAG